MSKKPNKSRHRVPTHALQLRSDPISERYQREIDMSMERLEQRYRKAQRALQVTERKVERARREAEDNTRNRENRRKYNELLELVEQRRRELRQIELLMMPATYNGRDSRRRGARHETGDGTISLAGQPHQQ